MWNLGMGFSEVSTGQGVHLPTGADLAREEDLLYMIAMGDDKKG